jgi:hypothetical protein
MPPYGGGGYVALTTDSKDIVEFELSFMFGAVVAIKFGPLDAQGRVVAGIFIFKSAQRRVIGAFIEAAGEGHIACFGISVCLQVGLRDDSGSGTLTGYCILSFTFKIGFVSVSFSFRAGYTIKNRGGGLNPGSGALRGSTPMLASLTPNFAVSADAEAPETGPRLTLKTPVKGTNWPAYRQMLAVELLAD